MSPVVPQYPGRWSLIAVLAASKAADAVTTYAGLRWASGVREGNPVVAGVMDAHGVSATIVATSLLAVAAIVAVTEVTVFATERWLDVPPGGDAFVRLVGYGLPAVVHFAVAAQNVTVLAAA